MSTPTFAETHNLVAFLEKPAESAGFEQIIDFLKSKPIHYALAVNPTIYVSCVKQFWAMTKELRVYSMKKFLKAWHAWGQTATGKEISNPFMAGSLPETMLLTFVHVICIDMSPFEFSFVCLVITIKTVNDVPRLQAQADKKKFIITEAMIKDALRLDDAEGKKFNFSKYIFDSLVRNVDSSTKFYMYPRFLQLMIRAQVGDLSSHSTKYSSRALIQKVFANMRRVGKGCSRVETPLFEGMIVAQQVGKGAIEVNVKDVPATGVADKGAVSVVDVDVPAAVDEPSIPLPTPPTQPPPPSQDIPSTSQVQPTPPLLDLKSRIRMSMVYEY
nr:hypothetical protein [Tanacetum cinerariifolium]